MEEKIAEKKRILELKKQEYSDLTNELSFVSQQNYKVIKNLKQQNLNIKKKTNKYVNMCVERALYEAEYEYSQSQLQIVTDQTEYNKEITNATNSREILLQKLEEYRQSRNQFIVNRNEISNESSRAKQHCLDAAFYCQDLKTKLSHDLRKSLHSNITYEITKNIKNHKKNLNDSISLVADRVLDSRQELKGYFKNQIMKLQREQRIMEETEAANKQKERILAEENGASTKEDIEKYLRTNKLFGADREDNANPETSPNNANTTTTNLSMSPQTPITNKLIPKPPTTPMIPSSTNNISPRVGNLVTMSASSKRKIRGTQSAVLNLDDICDELLTVCQLEGKKYRLETLKKMLQSHIINQISILSLVKSDLIQINNKYQNMKLNETTSTSNTMNSINSIIEEKEKTEITVNLTTNTTNTTNTTVSSLQQQQQQQQHHQTMTTSDSQLPNKFTSTSKKNIRHVYVNDNLSMIDDDIDDAHFSTSQKSQYLSTGLLYAQSLSIEIEANETELNKLKEANDETLHIYCHQNHDTKEINKLKEDHKLSVEKLNLLLDESEINPTENNNNNNNHIVSSIDNQSNTTLSATPSTSSISLSQTSSPITKSNRKTMSTNDKTNNSPLVLNKKQLGYNMQNETVQQLNKQKERDREREIKFKEEKNKQRKRLLSEASNEYGINSWCMDDKLRKMFIDILVGELDSSPDIPLEFGFVKLSSMSLMAMDEQASNHNNDQQYNAEIGSPRSNSTNNNYNHHNNNNSTTSSIIRRRSTYASQHRILLIEGLAAL